MVVLVMAVVMAAADSTVVLLAFPDMTQTLNTNVYSSIWTIFVYMLVTAVMTTQLGKIGDVYGRAKVFNAGFGLFTIASALCGLSPNIFDLIFFRLIQGIGAAMLLANSGAIVADNFPKEQLGKAYGYIASGWGTGTLLGIVLGGVLTTFFGWRYVFFINVPIGIVAVILGTMYIKSKGVMKRHIDILGMLLLGAALSIVSYDALTVAANGFSTSDGGLITLGAALVIIFLLNERRSKDPVIDMTVFRNKVLRYSLFASMFLSLGYFSIIFMLILFLQGIVGLSPLYAALLLSPGAFVGALLSPMMGRHSDRIGAGTIATLGVACFCIAVAIYYFVVGNYSPVLLIVGSLVSGLGTAMFYPANNASVMANAAPGYFGATNGLLRTMQNIGGVMSYVVVIYISSESIPRSVAFQVFVGTTQLLGGLTSAFINGIHTALIVSLGFMILAAIFSYYRSVVGKKK